MNTLVCGRHELDLSTVQVMGILNVTPDSFSDGGTLFKGTTLKESCLLSRAQQMVDSGATILDIGGESTRPDAEPVSAQEEMDRVLPAVEMLSRSIDVVISVDTSNPKLITQAASLGAGFVNDVRALEVEGAVEAVSAAGLPVCLMHMKGSPKTMQQAPDYQNVALEVLSYLMERVAVCEGKGIAADKIVLDPGFGFGKTMEQNFQLLRRCSDFVSSGYPLLIGTSRKSMFGSLLGREVGERLSASLASVAYAVMNGASIVRVHDVKETVDAVKVIEMIQRS